MTTLVYTSARRAKPLHLPESLFDAQSFVVADDDDAPKVLAVSSSHLIGMTAISVGIQKLTAAEALTILGLPADGTFALSYNDSVTRSSDVWAKIGNTQMSATTGFDMLLPGSIRGHSLMVEIVTAVSGDVTFEVRINNVVQGSLELEFTSAGGTGVKAGRVTASSGSVPFSAGDFLTLRENESAGGDMSWKKLMGTIWIELDS